MGITIHFEGSLSDENAYRSVIEIATGFAAQHQWPIEPIDRPHAELLRVKGEEPWNYCSVPEIR